MRKKKAAQPPREEQALALLEEEYGASTEVVEQAVIEEEAVRDGGTRGTWLPTFTGEAFDPFAPDPEKVHPLDIAHHLAHKVRWSGGVDRTYTVAEHSWRAARLVRERLRQEKRFGPQGALAVEFMTLLHDAAEVYLPDIPRPIKDTPLYAPVAKLELDVLRAVHKRFDLPCPYTEPGFEEELAIVKWADNVLLATEWRDLMPNAMRRIDWQPSERPLPPAQKIVPWPAPQPKLKYHDYLMQLSLRWRAMNNHGKEGQ